MDSNLAPKFLLEYNLRKITYFYKGSKRYINISLYRDFLNYAIYGTGENLRYSNPCYSSTEAIFDLKTMLFKDY